MDPTVVINERIDVITLYRHGGDAQGFCVPVRMRWRDKDITLTELALRHPTIAGKRMIHVFHVSDGVNNYRIEFDAERLTWQLVAVLPDLDPLEEEA